MSDTNATHFGLKVGDAKGVASFIAGAGQVGVAVLGAFDHSGLVAAVAGGAGGWTISVTFAASWAS